MPRILILVLPTMTTGSAKVKSSAATLDDEPYSDTIYAQGGTSRAPGIVKIISEHARGRGPSICFRCGRLRALYIDAPGYEPSRSHLEP